MSAGLIGLSGVLAAPLAQTNQNPEWGKAAPIGLFVLLAFVVVCIFLFRSMNRRIRKVPPTFGGPETPQGDRIGEASAVVPTVEFRDPAQQSAPRLGTPDALEAELAAKRQKRAREIRARRKPTT